MNLFGEEDIIYDDTNESDVLTDLIGGVESEKKGLKPARESSICLGHEKQEELFLDLFYKNLLPHAFIFSGHEGIGKTTIAFRLARFLFKYGKGKSTKNGLFTAPENKPSLQETLNIDEQDPVFRRVASGGHADFMHIARKYDASKGKTDSGIKVEAIRKIGPFLRQTSSEGGWRIVIIEDADTMNRNAQNAILKILEEPPEKAMIILVAHRSGMLIPTIRSRARLVAFSSLSSQVMNDLLSRQGYNFSAEQIQTLSDLSGGSIGKAISLADSEGLEILESILTQLNRIPDLDYVDLHNFSNTFSTSSHDVQYQICSGLLQWIIRSMLIGHIKGKESLPQCLYGSKCSDLLGNASLEKVISISDGLKNHFDRAEFSNLDRRDAVREAILMISQGLS